jgi:hypothetical protein
MDSAEIVIGNLLIAHPKAWIVGVFSANSKA